MKNRELKIVVFVAGAVVMSLEIFGFGIIAPYFGKSLITSSVLLSVIFLSLSFGYFVGGVLADRQKNFSEKTLAKIILTAGLFIGFVFVFRDMVGSYLRWHVASIAWGSLIFTMPFFIPVNALLGAVLPFSIRFWNHAYSKKISELYILSTLGSVFGTLFSGYILVPFVNISVAIAFFATILIALAVFLLPSLRFFLLLIPLFFYFNFIGTKIAYVPLVREKVVSDGSILLDMARVKKLDESFNQYGRIEIFEATDEASGKTVRLFRVNRELHSVSFLDSNELVLNYAKFNRLGGHFNPNAKKALLIGGGNYSYAKYFLGDTPLFDKERHWSLDGKNYTNINTVTVPILITSNPFRITKDATPIFTSSVFNDESEHEGEKNKIIAHNQHPGDVVVAEHAEINDTGMFENEGFVHVHEVNKDGMVGKVVSEDVSLAVPHEIIGHSDLFTGTNDNIHITMNRQSKDGETLYLMLHRDNGNKRFDQILVDGYEKIQKLDVVEIDPNATKFAKKYFGLNTADPRLRIFEEDGRTYLNRTKEKYDIIYFDAFQSFYSVPFQLVTLESYKKTFNALNDDGVVVANFPHIISGKFFQSELKTIKKVFPVVRVFAVDTPDNPNAVQSIVVIAFKSDKNIRTTPNFDDGINQALSHEWKGEPNPDAVIFTDDYAPTEYLVNGFINVPTM
jgi:predicted membrane-bound spermidine synthase